MISSFDARVQELRAIRKLSQVELAMQIGKTKQTVYNWEHRRASPDVYEIQGIAVVLKVSPAWLLGFDVDIEGCINENVVQAVEKSEAAFSNQLSDGGALVTALRLFETNRISEETLKAIIDSLKK